MRDGYENNNVFPDNEESPEKKNYVSSDGSDNAEIYASVNENRESARQDSNAVDANKSTYDNATVVVRSSERNITGAENNRTAHSEFGAPRGYYSGINRSSGEMTYAPNPAEEKKRKKAEKKLMKKQNNVRKGVNWAAASILVLVSLLLAAACGFGGAYVGNVYFGQTYGDTVEPLVIHRVDGTSSEGTNLTYADVVAKVENTVVSISTEYKATSFFGQYVTGGAGSGVIISENGYIVTNNHVICGSDSRSVADSIKVKLKNGQEYEAEVIGTDADSDIALLKIEMSGLIYAEFSDSDTLVVGEEVMAIGNPLGELSGTVTNGIISSLAREIEVDGTVMNLLQTNTAINPGNSGGGLFNMKGELVGVVNAKSSGTGIEGLGFAIPSNDALDTVSQLREKGYVSGRPFIGATIANIFDSSTASYYGVRTYGVYVTNLMEGLNDGEEGLKLKDRIISVNEQEIASYKDVGEIVKSSEVGDVLKFTIIREGKTMTVDVTCYESTGSNSSEDDGGIGTR